MVAGNGSDVQELCVTPYTCQDQTVAALAFEHHRLKGTRSGPSAICWRPGFAPSPCQDLQANRSSRPGDAGLQRADGRETDPLPESEQPKRVRTLIRHLLLVRWN